MTEQDTHDRATGTAALLIREHTQPRKRARPFGKALRAQPQRSTNGRAVAPPGPARDRAEVTTALVLAAQRREQGARDRVVTALLPALTRMSSLYIGFATVDRSELVQAGVVGVLTAVDRFDPSMGVPFWAYASWWVRQTMQRHVAEMTGPMVLSDRAARVAADMRRARVEHQQRFRRDPSIAELCVAAGVRRDQVESVLASERPPKSLTEPIAEADAAQATIGDLLADPTGEEAYERVLERGLIDDVHEATRGLDERERKIVFSHYGLGCRRRTLREIATEFDLSVERIRQLEERALQKIRAAVTGPASGGV